MLCVYSLYETIDSLESRCEDLQHLVDDMGHLKKDDSAVSDEGTVGGSAADDQDEYAKLVSQLEHAKNQRAKEQRKVSELEQNVSLLIQVKIKTTTYNALPDKNKKVDNIQYSVSRMFDVEICMHLYNNNGPYKKKSTKYCIICSYEEKTS